MAGVVSGTAGGAGTGFAVGGPLGAAIGGLIGLGSGLLGQEDAEKQRKFEAAKAITSPWLGLAPSAVKTPNVLSQTIGGAGAGLDFASKNGSLWDKLASGASSGGGMGGSGSGFGLDLSGPFQSSLLRADYR